MKNIFIPGLSMLLSVSALVAQPDSLAPVWLSYIPNTNLSVRDVHTDCSGNVIYVGGTSATGFQCSPGTINTSYLGGNSDAFVVKVDSSGQVLWSTLLGGPQYDRAYAVEVDSAGFIYVAGRAGNGLQTTECALQQNFAGDNYPNPAYGIQDGFVVKITPDGTQIVWATYIGCDGRGFVRDIDLDSKGNVWAAISVASPNLPYISANAVQTTATNAANPALVKISADGKSLLFGTFLADGVFDGGPSTVRVDRNDNAFFLSHASANNIPVTPGAFQPAVAGDVDFVVSKFDSTGNLLFCSFLGGSGKEEVETHSLEIDSYGNVIMAAYTYSSADYPIVGAVFQNTYKGDREGVITKIAADGSAILASTFLGGTGLDEIEGIGITADDVVYVSGTTMSPDFPVTVGTAYQSTIGGGRDGYIAALLPDLSAVLYATFAGGSLTDNLRCCHVDAWGRIYAGGLSASTNYPVYDPFYATLTGANTGVVITLRPNQLTSFVPTCSITNTFADPCLSSGTVDLVAQGVFISPNPVVAGSSFFIRLPSAENADIALFDPSGRLGFKRSIQDAYSLEIPTNGLVPGVYFLEIKTQGKTYFEKIIIGR